MSLLSTVTRNRLQAQKFTKATDSYRSLSSNPLAWAPAAQKPGLAGNGVHGWLLDLPQTGEQVVADPASSGRLALFATLTPNADPCQDGVSTWLLALNPLTGGAPLTDALDYNNDGVVDARDRDDGNKVAGMLLPGGLVITDNKIARLEDFGAFDWVPMLLGDQKLTAKPNEEQDLVDWLLDMPALPQLDLPKSLQLEEVRPVPEPRLVFRSPSKRGWKHERIHANVEFDYDGTLVRGSNVQWAVVQRDQGRCLLRDQQQMSHPLREFWQRDRYYRYLGPKCRPCCRCCQRPKSLPTCG